MFRVICNIVIAIIVIGALAILVVLGIPLVMGKQMYAVLTASMEPTYPEGSIVVVEEFQPEQVQVNDVITYAMENFDVVITHRVMEIDSEQQYFYTKGDNNAAADFAPVHFSQMIGKVEYGIPVLGAFIANIRTPGGILLIVWVVLIVILMLVLPDLIDRVRDAGKEKRKAEREAWQKARQKDRPEYATGATGPPARPGTSVKGQGSWRLESLHKTPGGGEQ